MIRTLMSGVTEKRKIKMRYWVTLLVSAVMAALFLSEYKRNKKRLKKNYDEVYKKLMKLNIVSITGCVIILILCAAFIIFDNL